MLVVVEDRAIRPNGVRGLRNKIDTVLVSLIQSDDTHHTDE